MHSKIIAWRSRETYLACGLMIITNKSLELDVIFFLSAEDTACPAAKYVYGTTNY